MSKIQLSVLLPFRDAEKSLEDAARSILDQNHPPPFELLLIDNASSDAGPACARKLAKADPRVRLLHEPMPGVALALNHGWRNSQGKYILRMDADDFAHPDRMAEQFQFLEAHPEVGLVASLVAHGGAPGGYEKHVQWLNQLVSHEQIALNRFVESPIAHPSVCFRSELSRLGRYRQGDFPEDYELWLRWLDQGVLMRKLTRELLTWNDSPGRLSRTDQRYREAAFYRTKAEYLARYLERHNPHHPKLTVWGAGRLSRRRSDYLLEQGIQIEQYVDIVPAKTTVRNCILPQQLPAPGQLFVASFVANWSAREQIRAILLGKSYREGKDFIMAA